MSGSVLLIWILYLVAIASPAAWLCQALLLPKWLSSLLQDGLDSFDEFTVVGDTTPLEDFTNEFWEMKMTKTSDFEGFK